MHCIAGFLILLTKLNMTRELKNDFVYLFLLLHNLSISISLYNPMAQFLTKYTKFEIDSFHK